jgi:hypothetical protein
VLPLRLLRPPKESNAAHFQLFHELQTSSFSDHRNNQSTAKFQASEFSVGSLACTINPCQAEQIYGGMSFQRS